MKVKCVMCGFPSKKHGKTSAGKQRWRCTNCGATFTLKLDDRVKRLQMFLDWLFSKQMQKEMKGNGRTFRRKTAEFWNIWALPPKIDRQSSVVYVDGIYLSRELCVLICCDDKHVLGWYVCRSENTRAWIALIERIAMPILVVSDGGSGFQKALKTVWPQTRHQRCLFHVFSQVRRYTTRNPQTAAGKALYSIAKGLFDVRTLEDALKWTKSFNNWIQTYKRFLEETTTDETGRKRLTHERLVKAQNSLIRLLKAHTLFTYLDEELRAECKIPTTNNRIEGGVNAQLRALLRTHRGLPLDRRLKAVYWWCYMHSPRPLSVQQILSYMPTDATIAAYYSDMRARAQVDRSIPTWGDAIVWNELHMSTLYPTYWD